jgi:hypothetical protein
MEFNNITTQQKITKMNETKVRMELELFDRLLEVGLDPDTFVLSTCELPEGTPLSHPWGRILDIKAATALINAKLEELQ